MKKLTKEEADRIMVKPSRRSSLASMYLLNMNVGDIILLEPKDWKQRNRNPSSYCILLGRRTGRTWKCEAAMDNTGWVIERIT